jgi:hypothetical protein
VKESEYRAILSALDHALSVLESQISPNETERKAHANLKEVRASVTRRIAELARDDPRGIGGGS